MGRYKFILISLIFLGIISLNFASAALLVTHSSPTIYNINRSLPNQINFSVIALSHNITSFQVTVSGGALLVPSSNWSSVSLNLTSYVNSSTQTFIWRNATSVGIVPNNTNINFSIQVIPIMAGAFNVMVNSNTSSTAVGDNSSILSFIVNFAFSGMVKNETGSLISGVNISIYNYQQSQDGPPVETLAASSLSNSDGVFNFWSINGSAPQYKIKMVYINSTGVITKVGSNLPAFPAVMFYPQSMFMGSGMKEFMKPPNLNGTTFYVQPAATISLFIVNASNAYQNFGYQLIDQKVGFPVESNMKNKAKNINITVPTGRLYTVMALRDPSQFPFDVVCQNVTTMNDSTCPAPPKSNSTLPTLNEGDVVSVIINLTISQKRFYGCLDFQGNTTAITNITSIVPKLVPWPGFVPSIKAEIGQTNLASQATFNISDPKCAGKWAFYNLTVMNSDYIVEFYARNASDFDLSKAEYVGAMQNVSISSSDVYMNITLKPLAGKYWTGDGINNLSLTDLNVTKIRINIQNSSGSPMTTSMHAELKVKNSVFGTLNYIIDSNQMTNGTFFMPVLAGSSWAKVLIYPNEAPPTERTINLSLAETNITTTSNELGFRKMLSNGTIIQTNISDTSTFIEMRFLRNSVACNIVGAGASCEVTKMNAEDFNPLKALVAGKVNLEMKLVPTNKRDNVTITYWNFDMFSAKPPTNSMMNQNASSTSSAQQIWQFGGFAPSDAYDNITISVPYSSDSGESNFIDEDFDFNITLPILYSESSVNQGQLEVAWNSSTGQTAENLPDDFSEYNRSSFRDYLVPGGMSCSKTNNNASCYWDQTAKKINIKVPHFSGVAPTLSGVNPTTTTTSTTTASSGTSTVSFWTREYSPSEDQLKAGYTQALEVKAQVKFSINSAEHSVGIVGLTSTTATINVSSTPQQETLTIGQEKKFDVNVDNYYDVLVKLISITNSQANITIQKISEKMPASAITPPSAQESNENIENNTTATNTTTETLKSLKSGIIIAVVIIAVVLIVLYFFYKKKRYYHKGY